MRGEPPAGFPVEPNTIAEVDGTTVLWLGPDEWLVLGGREEDFPDAAAAVDVSANRVVLRARGRTTRPRCSRRAARSTSHRVFAPGRCAQTLLARAQVILVRPDESRFLVLVRPSFAPYLRAWLEDAIEGVTTLRSSR